MVVCAIAILIFALGTFLRALCNYTRLRTVPGPLFTGLSDLWRTYARNTRSYGSRLASFHEEYGKVVRLGPHSISVSDPTAIFPVYRGRPGERPIFENQYYTVFAQGPSIDGTGSVNFENRFVRNAVRWMHLESARRYESIIDQSTSNLLGYLRRHPLVHLTTFLGLFDTNFDHPLGLGEFMTDDMSSRAEVAGCHWYSRIGKWLKLQKIEYALLKSPSARLKRSRGIAFVRKTIPQETKDTQYYYHGGMYDRSTSSDLGLISNTGGGLRSVTMAFVSTFAFLLEHEDAMTRLRNEIDTAFNKGFLSDPPRRKELSKLRYLDAVFKESMRQSPRLTYHHNIVTPPEGAVVAGYYIPPGTMIELHSEALRCDPDMYGPDVHNYRPTRWLNADPRQWRNMNQNLLVFSTSCPTVQVAWLELKKVLVLTLMKFTFQLISPNGELTSTIPATELDRDGQPLMVYCRPRIQ
ncbi:cytochrome P450 [Aspergillus coremiiformis]|uniref:Cytochrome P450 n=1 Tax=Aspergillus coremiiformis TaxID=138285 RepID=A0A5N6ZE62_9EURO|nr:cytochrome P450 [Aspergillus coremiiformis]